mgnify:CR=1 FL=1
MPNYRYNTQDYMRRRPRPQNIAPMAEARPGTPCAACTEGRYDELSEMPLAMAYVPWQTWCNLYEAEKGFCRGTIFEELDKPFKGIGGCQNVR